MVSTEYSNRRTLGDVAAIVASDELFNRHSFDAYSLSLGTHLLPQHRTIKRRKCPGFGLRTKGRLRGPFENYSTQERLQDFRDAFGDPATIEQGLLRFLEEMASN
ncbi:MAG UNVERIFIED_CONTAM: hypothetical protein LVR18_06260 [Planctomycetaceae bacterium]|jgi:hypothetical protein